MKKIICLALILVVFPANLCSATTASQILRMQEMQEKERALRERMEEEKYYIKDIVVNGSTMLSKRQIDNIMMPYKERLLSKEDIGKILELIKSVYAKLEAADKLSDISYRVAGERLVIDITEAGSRE